MKYIVFHAPKGRPINLIIFYDQVQVFLLSGQKLHKIKCTLLFQATLLLSHSGFTILVIASMASGLPLQELIGGDLICPTFWSLGAFYSCFTNITSCGMAIYRVLTMKFQMWAKYTIGDYRLAFIIISMSMAFQLFLIHQYTQAMMISSPPGMNFCHGRSPEHSEIIANYEGTIIVITFLVRIQLQ